MGRKALAARSAGKRAVLCTKAGLGRLGLVPPNQAQWPQLCHEHIFRL